MGLGYPSSKIWEFLVKSLDISGDRDIFHSPWVSGLPSFTFFSLFPNTADHISETKARM